MMLADMIYGILIGFAISMCIGFCLILFKSRFSSSEPQQDLRCNPTELFFFPDSNMPCFSYYADKPCFNQNKKDKKCKYLHTREESSLIKVMETMKLASQIDLCMFLFTIKEVAEFLIKLKRQGTRIRIIADKAHEPLKSDQTPRLKEAGIEVRERPLDPDSDDRTRPLMHNKFVIVDRKCCMLGSFNWTYPGVTKNSETVIKSHEPAVVRLLAQKFEKMWRDLRNPVAVVNV